MSSADLVTCLCKGCSSLLCVSTNDWIEVTASYATYHVEGMFSHPGLEQSGPLRPGSKDSELEGCTVQAVNCIECKQSIGVKCTSVVPEKEMHRDRCFLKLGKLKMQNLTGTPVEPRIRTKGSSRSDANSSATIDHTDTDAPRAKNLNESHSSARRSLETETSDEQDGMQSDTMQALQRQEDSIGLALSSMETLQKQMKTLRKEMKMIKKDMDVIRVRQDEQPNYELTTDIDLLTETVSTVSGKLGELDSLKLEIKVMQNRVKRLEDEKRGLKTGREPPDTPRSVSNGARPALLPKPLGNTISSPRRSMPIPIDDRASSRSRASSVLGTYSPRSSRTDMPPPKLPQNAPDRTTSNRPTGRSASETARNPHGRSALRNAVSALNESADEFPSIPQADDDEYNDEDSDDDPEYEDPPRRSRQSLPTRLSSVPIDTDEHSSLSNLNTNKRRRTTSHALDRDGNTPPSPHPDDPDYKSIWAAQEYEPRPPAPVLRNELGMLIKPNGQVDKRSLRFVGKPKNKRKSVPKEAPRDAEGYLLDPDGSRNERSVRIIDGMRKREREERESTRDS